MFQKPKVETVQQMEQAEDTLSDISEFLTTLINGKEDNLSGKGTIHFIINTDCTMAECKYI